MARRDDILSLLKSLADATDNDGMKSAMGTPGSQVLIGGQPINTGSAINPEPTPFTLLVDAIASYLDSFHDEIIAEVEDMIDAAKQEILESL